MWLLASDHPRVTYEILGKQLTETFERDCFENIVHTQIYHVFSFNKAYYKKMLAIAVTLTKFLAITQTQSMQTFTC